MFSCEFCEVFKNTFYTCYKKIYEKPKVTIQIFKNAKSLNANNQKCKKEQVQSNERTLNSRPLWPFLKGTETKYEMKTKRVLISKEQKQI